MTNTAVDFGIVTALKIERDALLKRLDSYKLIKDENETLPFYLGQLSVPGSAESYTIVVCLLLDMGNDEAAFATTRLIQRWKPAHILMVGIAGGIHSKVELGDVVIAKYSFYYEPAKLTSDGEQMRPEQFPVDRLLLSRAYTYEATEWRGKIEVEPPRTPVKAPLPNIHFAPIASGEKVIADSTTIPKLLQICPKLAAVAMEGAGVARAAKNHAKPPRFLEIRGISDFADPEKNDDWHKYAANTAAAFTIGWLRDRPVPPVTPTKPLSATSRKPLLILCAQSLRAMDLDEIVTGFDESWKQRERETIVFDFTNFVQNGVFKNPEEAVQQLTNPQGALLNALARSDKVALVFQGVVHIPIQFLMGHLVSNRIPVQLFEQNSTDGNINWAWTDKGENFPELEDSGIPNHYSWPSKDVILRVSVTFPVRPEQTATVNLPDAIEIDLTIPKPEWGIVRSERQVREYGRKFRRVLDRISNNLSLGQKIHLFYAGPNSLGFHLGQQISENIHPPIIVWNYHKGYDWGIDLTAAYSGELSIIRP
ncbi:MAG: SAVED domain-containing protein [Cyanobacteria bacterium P01_E01_bin.42]